MRSAKTRSSKKRRRHFLRSPRRLALLAAALLFALYWGAGPLFRWVGYQIVCRGTKAPCGLLRVPSHRLAAMGLSIETIPQTDQHKKNAPVSFRRRVGCEREITLGGSSFPSSDGGREGAWTFSLDDTRLAARMRAGSCVVYSFGVRDDYSFEAAVSRLGCEVWAFDPNVSAFGRTRDLAPNVHFERSGIARAGAADATTSGAPLRSLGDIMKSLGRKISLSNYLGKNYETHN